MMFKVLMDLLNLVAILGGLIAVVVLAIGLVILLFSIPNIMKEYDKLQAEKEENKHE